MSEQLQTVTLPAQGEPITSTRLRARHDLQLPGVIIRYEQADDNGVGSVYQIDKFPGPDVTNPAPGTLVTTITIDNTTAWAVPSSSNYKLGIPNGLAQFIYNEYADLQYDGTHTLVDDEPGGRTLIGCALNLTGGRTEWASMRATIHGVSENLKTGVTTITVGPAPMGGPDTWRRIVQLHGSKGIPGRPKAQAARDVPGTSLHGAARNASLATFDAILAQLDGDIANMNGTAGTPFETNTVLFATDVRSAVNQLRINFNRP